MRVKEYIVLIVSVLLLQSCYSHREIGLLQDRKHLPKYEHAEYSQYRLQVNDEIIYRLISMDETIAPMIMTSQSYGSSGDGNSYRIYSDGTIDLPFLRPIHIEGLTLPEAQDTVQKYFREIIPDAEIKLTLYNKTFTIIGDINSGTFPIYKDKLTIFQALAMSGDIHNGGDRQHVRILRHKGNDKPDVLEFDIRSNTVIDSEYYYIYPNDIIYVSRSRGSFYKVASYSGFLSLITSSLSLLVSVINYTTLVP